MKTLIAFSTEEEIFDILGWEWTADRYDDSEWLKKHDALWEAGFNLDDWDIGFACREKLVEWVDCETGEPIEADTHWGDYDSCSEPSEDVYWLVRQMENYCVGMNYCYFEGWHWYTVHHS